MTCYTLHELSADNSVVVVVVVVVVVEGGVWWQGEYFQWICSIWVNGFIFPDSFFMLFIKLQNEINGVDQYKSRVNYSMVHWFFFFLNSIS